MADATKKERATEDRGKDVAAKMRPYVLLRPGTRGGFEAVIIDRPPEITFEEEEAIKPSQQFREQGVRQQAESVLKNAAKGQHFKDDYLDKLEQQLRKSGSAKDLSGAVGQLRTSQRAKDEARLTASANRGLEASTKDKQPAPPGAVSPTGIPAAEPEKPPEIVFPDPNPYLAGIGVVLRQWEARGLTNRFAQGEQITSREARRASERLLAAEKQAAIYGKGSEDLGQVIDLGEITDSQLKKAVEEVQASERKGGRAGGKQLTYLARGALGMERQYQLLGQASSGTDLASRLGDVKRSHIETDINAVLEKAKKKERSGGAYIDHLQEDLLASERQLQLLGQKSESSDNALELATALGKAPRLPLADETKQVIDGLRRGQDLDDEYVDFLRQRLVTNAERRGNVEARQLAAELREAQASRLEVEVRKTLSDAKGGKRFAEFYLTYLQQRMAEAVADETSQDKKAQWATLSKALDDLIR